MLPGQGGNGNAGLPTSRYQFGFELCRVVRWVRGVEYLEISDFLSIVCTIDCVHTILQD